MSQYKPGDVVQLKSGGPKMTVDTEGSEGYVHCKWFVGTELKEGTFAVTTLQEPGSQVAVVRTRTQRGY